MSSQSDKRPYHALGRGQLEGLPRSRRLRRGGVVLEMAFFMPWFIFLFIGTFDCGFYAHALISVENAARVAALYTSSSTANAADITTACTYALEELRIVANIGSTTTCSALLVIVTATSIMGPDNRAASQVAVTDKTLQLIPIPGLLTGRATFYRVVKMRVSS